MYYIRPVLSKIQKPIENEKPNLFTLLSHPLQKYRGYRSAFVTQICPSRVITIRVYTKSCTSKTFFIIFEYDCDWRKDG